MRDATAERRATGVPPRVDFVDFCKALGIVLVVYAHAPGTPAVARTLIYSFHMPLFFFASGYLLRAERIAARPGDTLRHLARALLLPYLYFFLLSLAWWLATRNIGARAQKFAGLTAGDAWLGLATGLSSDLFVNVTLWFLPCMFACQLIFVLARRVLAAGALLLASTLWALLLLTFSLPWPVRLPWGLDIVWIALVFFAAGHGLRAAGADAGVFGRRGCDARHLLLALLLALSWLGMVVLQGGVDLARASFGHHPWLYLPCALAGVACAVLLGQCSPRSHAARLLSQHSLAVFALHPLLIELLSGVVKLSGLQAHVLARPVAWSLVCTAWGLATGLATALLLARHAPLLLGLRGAPALVGRA